MGSVLFFAMVSKQIRLSYLPCGDDEFGTFIGRRGWNELR